MVEEVYSDKGSGGFEAGGDVYVLLGGVGGAAWVVVGYDESSGVETDGWPEYLSGVDYGTVYETFGDDYFFDNFVGSVKEDGDEVFLGFTLDTLGVGENVLGECDSVMGGVFEHHCLFAYGHCFLLWPVIISIGGAIPRWTPLERGCFDLVRFRAL